MNGPIAQRTDARAGGVANVEDRTFDGLPRGTDRGKPHRVDCPPAGG